MKFITELRKLAGKMFMRSDGAIRHIRYGTCPIIAALGKTSAEFNRVAQAYRTELELSDPVVLSIIRASDNRLYENVDRKMRDLLIRELGLS